MPYCPCGLPIPEGKLYCNSQHRGKYHKCPVRGTNFGMEHRRAAKWVEKG